MKLINYSIAASLFLAANLAYSQDVKIEKTVDIEKKHVDFDKKKVDVDKKEVDKYAVTRMISVDDAVGSPVWDHHGNQIGSISKILLKPLHSETLFAIIDVDWLDESRKIAVPWNKIYVRTKADDPEKIIYTLDVTKEYVRATPVYNDTADFTDVHVMEVRQYWKVDESGARLKVEEKTTTRKIRDTETLERDLPDPE